MENKFLYIYIYNTFSGVIIQADQEKSFCVPFLLSFYFFVVVTLMWSSLHLIIPNIIYIPKYLALLRVVLIPIWEAHGELAPWGVAAFSCI